jgi:hypothetical protein
MEDPAIMPPKPDNGKAWLFWCLSTIVLPAMAGVICFKGEAGPGIALVLGLVASFMHLTASLKLDGLNGCAVFFLYVGGWTLMLASFFVGCVASFPKL